METISVPKSERKFLTKEISLLSPSQTMNIGRKKALVSNSDPVLTYLAMQNESAYRIMERNNSAVGSSRGRRDTNLLSEGSSIVLGSSGSKGARLLRDFTIAFFKNIHMWPSVEKLIMDAMYVGWRPMEKIYESNFRFRRSNYWVPKYFREKNQENFKFTQDRDLARINPLTGDYEIYDTDVDKLKWLTPAYGSTNDPYGKGVYQGVWLTHFARDSFFEMFTQGMQRSMGMMKLKQALGIMNDTVPVSDSSNPAEVMNSITGELQQILNVLNSHNVLIERSGWTIDFLTNVTFADGWIKALDYIDRQISLMVATENLSWQDTKNGSRSNAVVGARSGDKTAVQDARTKDSWITDLIIRPTLELNFGEIDPADLPHSISHVRMPMDGNVIKLFSDMGVDLDGDEIARRFYLPIATEETKNVLKGVQKSKTGPTRQDTSDDPKKEVQKENEKSRRSDA